MPVGIVESEHGFVLHYKIMWREQDVEVAQPLVQATQALYPELAGCSFDKGFHSPGNRAELDKVLALNALPQKGKLSQAGREREAEAAFAEARRMHPLDRVRSRGPEGFERAVGLSVLALNLHRIGLILQRRERERLKRARQRRRSGPGSGTGWLPGGRSAREVRKVSESGFETGLGTVMRGQTGLETAPDNRTVTRFTYAPEQKVRVLSQTLSN